MSGGALRGARETAAPQTLLGYSAAGLETERAERHLAPFVRAAWSVLEPSAPLLWNWHIDAICEHLEAVSRHAAGLPGGIADLLILIPPRHGKSLIVSCFWDAWEWGPQNHAHLRWLYSSYAATLAIRDSVGTRTLIQSPWYQARWGSRFTLKEDQDTKTSFHTAAAHVPPCTNAPCTCLAHDPRGYRMATSVGGSNTGFGGDIIVCDDPHNVKEAHSEIKRKAAISWWNVVMSTRRNNPQRSARVIIMQRVHEDDVAGDVMAQGGYEVLVLPTEYDPTLTRTTSIGWSDPRRAEGELLWPSRYPLPWVAKTKSELGGYDYGAQHGQRPSAPEGGLFQRAWMQHWTAMPTQVDDLLLSFDCAFKDLKDSDWVVGQVWARVLAKFYLLDQVRAHLTFPGTLSAVRTLKGKWPYAASVLVEDKANGTAVIQTLTEEIPGIIAVEPLGGKVARAAAVTPLFEAHQVYLPPPEVEWVHDYIEELCAFNRGKHDDQVDATSQALMRLKQGADKLVLLGSSGVGVPGAVWGGGRFS